MSHVVRHVGRMAGGGGVVHVGDGRVIQLKLVSSEHIHAGGLVIFREVELVLLLIDSRSVMSGLHIKVVILWGVDSVCITAWSSDVVGL